MQLADSIHLHIPACGRNDMCLFGPGLLPLVLATGMQLQQASEGGGGGGQVPYG